MVEAVVLMLWAVTPVAGMKQKKPVQAICQLGNMPESLVSGREQPSCLRSGLGGDME